MQTDVTKISVKEVKVSAAHRAIKPWLLEQITGSMKEHGYNVAYPIVIDNDGTLVEGRHRIEAASIVGIEEVPFIYKPADVPAIRFGLQCNADGQLTAADDVFDLAELCWNLSEIGKMTGDQIAETLGWDNRTKVVQYKAIKDGLHPKSWSVTKNSSLVTDGENESVTQGVTKVTPWRETHFRAFLKHLPCPNGDRNLMRHQLRALREVMDGKKITASTCEKVAQKHAWYATLARRMNNELAQEVGIHERIRLYKNIQNGVFGKAAPQGDGTVDTFGKAIAAINEDILKVKLYHGDSLKIIPQLDDNSISLVVTDPPYNTTDHAWDQYGTADQFIEWMQDWISLVKPKLKDDYHLFIFCDPDYMAAIEMMLKANGWPIKSRIIWEYRNLVKGRDVTDKFIENYQVCFHCGTHPLNWSENWDDSRFMVQRHATPQSNFIEGKHHPTAKPLSLIKLLVELGSKPGDVVVDMFAGGGTTGEACKDVGQRRCVLIERDDKYCQVIEARLKIKRIENE